MKGIPYWREVTCDGDEVYIYQCLSCKEEWWACTSPSHWTFCPYCGLKWVGEKIGESHANERKGNNQ